MSRIGIDLDGVMFDFIGTFERLYAEWFGFPIAPIKQWNDPLKHSHFKTYEDLWAWFERADGWAQIPYVDGARGSIDHLLEEGHNLVFITARHGEGATAAYNWHSRSPWADDSFIAITSAKQTVPCDIYVDDGPHIIEELRLAGKNTIVFNRPWNKDAEGVRASDWIDVVALIEEWDA